MAQQIKNSILFFLTLFISTTAFSLNTTLFAPDTLTPPPYIPDTLSGPNWVCQGDTSLYTGDFYIGCDNIWYIDNEFQTPDGDSLLVVWSNPEIHIVKAYCGDTNSLIGLIVVTVNPLPVVFLGNDTTLQEGETLWLDAGNPGSHYQWSTGDTTQTILVTQTGLYSVIVTNNCGEDSDEIFVDILTSVYSSKPNNLKVRAINGSIIFKNYEGGEFLTINSLLGETIYNGKIKSNIKLPVNQLVIVNITSGKTQIVFKIYIP